MALPGVRTNLLNRFYNLGRTDLPGGPLIAVIARRGLTNATPVPDFTPFYPSSELEVITEFGEGSQLHRAYYELTTFGAPRVVLIPIPEDTTFDHSTGTLSSNSTSLDVFDEAFAAVETTRADIVVPWGRGSAATDWEDPATPGNDDDDYFYADNHSSPSNSWIVKVANKCLEISTNSYPIVAVMGVKPLAGAENPTLSDISTGFAFTNLLDRESPNFDYGHMISVVAAEIHPIGAPSDWGWSNGACAYAALVARLDPQSATSGKPVFNADRMRYNPNRTQAEALIEKGLVPAHLDFNRSPRWTDGTTFAKEASDFIRLSTVRIAFDVVKIIRQISQNYIGEGMSLDARNAFETQISSALRAMQQRGAITNSDFRVLYRPADNEADVDIAVTPAFEMRVINLNVSVNF